MNFKIPHKTSQILALKKVRQALEHARPQMKGHATIQEERWDDYTLHFAVTVEGKSITGSMEVTNTDYVINAKLPLLWRLFEGRIEKMISEQVKQMT